RRQRREPELEATCLALHPLEHLTETKPQARLLPRHTQQLRIEPLDRLEPLGRIPCAPHAHKLANDGSNVDFKNTRSSFFRAAWCDQCRDSRALATRRWALARVPITRASTPPRAWRLRPPELWLPPGGGRGVLTRPLAMRSCWRARRRAATTSPG